MRPLNERVLDLVQAGFPLEADPYAAMAASLEATPAQVHGALAELRRAGTVRRVGASFSSKHLGYTSTLCALAVPPERDLDAVVDIVNALPNVTHNYLRPHRYNVWFTLIARSRDEIAALMRRIVEETGCEDALELPATALYKIRVDFSQMDGASDAARPSDAAEPSPAAASAAPPFNPHDPFDRALVRWAQGDIVTSGASDPFAEAAVLIGAEIGRPLGEPAVLERLRAWRDQGVIRRFGAMVRHRSLGYAFNGMAVWDIADERADEAGRLFARERRVSHCYKRPRAPKWNGNLYTMVHAQSQQQLDQAVGSLRASLAEAGVPAPEPLVLVSTKECKKTSMRYFTETEEVRS